MTQDVIPIRRWVLAMCPSTLNQTHPVQAQLLQTNILNTNKRAISIDLLQSDQWRTTKVSQHVFHGSRQTEIKMFQGNV